MVRKNAIFFILDAMRYDVASDPKAFEALAPNIARLASAGFVRKVCTNAQSTQFVMPSLFSLTYPLDFGGYNNGILDRPKSYVEVMREHGYRTIQFSTCNQIGVSNGYQRGFDVVGMTSDYRTLLEQRISRGISYYLGLWQEGEMTDAKIVSFLQRDFGLLLDSMVDALQKHDRSIWPPKLRRINQWIGDRCKTERHLLNTEPMIVAQKLKRVAAGLYWRYLGERTVPQWRLLPIRLIAGIGWRSRSWISQQMLFPFLRLAHYQSIFGDVVQPIAQALRNMSHQPWMMHMHAMDTHDCRAINRPLHVLGRLRFLPRWLRARRMGLTKRRFLYDSALMYVDMHFGKLVDALRDSGMLEHTVILITGDHGLQYAESPRKKTPLGERMHYEDIEVPLILFGADVPPSESKGFLDSRTVTASFLRAVGVEPHPSFVRATAFNDGLDVVISESCGHGAADLTRRDIYFGVTAKAHRMFGMLTGREFQVGKLYELAADPKELTNVAAKPENKAVIASLVRRLFEERRELFQLRGINEPPLSPQIV